MSHVICAQLEAESARILRPLLERSRFKLLRYLQDVPPERLCDHWLGEIVATLDAPGGVAFVAETNGRPCGFCVLADLPWESAIVGKKMAAIKYIAAVPEQDNAAVLDALLDQALRRARDGGYDFLLGRTYTDDIATVHALERQRFHLVDTLLDFDMDLRMVPHAARPVPPIPRDINLRLAGEADRSGLIEVARAAFAKHFGRFNSDPRLAEYGLKIYERWIESCLDGWADLILVAEVTGRIVAYSTWKRPSPREVSHHLELGHYNIVATHPDFYGRGLFAAMTHKGTGLLEGLATRIEGPTHVNNYGCQRGLLKLGWRIEDAHHSFHKWLSD